MSKASYITHFLFELVMLLSLECLRLLLKPLKTTIIKLIRVNLSITKSPENAAPPHKKCKRRVRFSLLVSRKQQSSGVSCLEV